MGTCGGTHATLPLLGALPLMAECRGHLPANLHISLCCTGHPVVCKKALFSSEYSSGLEIMEVFSEFS